MPVNAFSSITNAETVGSLIGLASNLRLVKGTLPEIIIMITVIENMRYMVIS